MKTLLLTAFLSFSAIAAVSPEDKFMIKQLAPEVMFLVGANPKLNPKVLSTKIINELGNRVQVEFIYKEDMFGVKKCTFIYDMEVQDLVQNSWLCKI